MPDVESQFKIEDPEPNRLGQGIYNESLAFSDRQRFQSAQQISDLTPITGTPAPSESPPQSHNHERSPSFEGTPVTSEWYDMYRPSKRRRKFPRPGESTFRVPMSMEQRKSLGASVRPKETQGIGIMDVPPVYGEHMSMSAQGDNAITPVTRGGTKMKFRAYGTGSLPPPMTTRSNNGSQLPVVNIAPQHFALEQTSNQHSMPVATQPSSEINFPTAPLENGPKLAWWLAQQISQMSLVQFNNVLSPQIAEIPAQHFYGNGETSPDKRRLADRERKAKWREANIERNRENDLRARVNRQARIKFGEIETSEKSDWVMAEMSRRKLRREEKQIWQASKTGHFPTFSNTEVVRSSLLRESSTYLLHDHARRFRQLLVDILFPPHDQTDSRNRYQSIQMLAEAINNRYPQDEEGFRAAFASIAGDEVAFNTIKYTMEQFITEEDDELDAEGPPLTPGKNNHSISESSPSHIISTLNEVLAILRELHEMSIKQQLISAKGPKAQDGPRKPSQREHRQHLKDFGITESRLEDFLVHVNGAPLEPDPDDDFAAQLFGNDLEIKVPLPASRQTPKDEPQNNDSDIWTTINSVLETLLERCIPSSKRSRRVKKVRADEIHVNTLVGKVKTLLTDIGIGSNRILDPVALQAVSEFWNRLTNFNTSQSFGEDLPIPPPQTIQKSSPATYGLSVIPSPNAGSKRKYTGDSPIIGQSPSAALPLPDATNPFADDNMMIQPPPSHHISYATSPLRSPLVDRIQGQHHPPPAPRESGVQSYSTYPQFQHANPSGVVRP